MVERESQSCGMTQEDCYSHGKRVSCRHNPGRRVTDPKVEDLAFLHKYVQRRHNLLDGSAMVPLGPVARGYERRVHRACFELTQ